MHLWLLRTLSHPSYISSALLLAPSGCPLIIIFIVIFIILSESRHSPGSLPQCSLPGRQQDVGDELRGAVGGEEGVDQGGARITAQADV